jgi:hypothetical protein
VACLQRNIPLQGEAVQYSPLLHATRPRLLDGMGHYLWEAWLHLIFVSFRASLRVCSPTTGLSWRVFQTSWLTLSFL